MSIAEKARAKAAALRAGKKSVAAPAKKATEKKNGKAVKVKTAKKKNGDSTPRAESKTAKILEMLKHGSSRESIRKKYDMEKLSDVGWYISKFKNKGLLPKTFERE